MRTNIHHEDKKEELIKNIWQIFLECGYEKTTLSLIIKNLSISKGVFYHYFKNKEDCAKSCAEYYACCCLNKLKLLDNCKNTPLERVILLIKNGASLSSNKDIQKINTEENQIFHKMVMVQIIKKISPLYAQIFEEGKKLNEFKLEYPLETAEMILTVSHFYLDREFFEWNLECDMNSKIKICESTLCKALGISEEKYYKVKKEMGMN